MMKTMTQRIALAAAIAVCLQAAAEATWSVIALDRTSRVVVIASATCVPQRALEGFPAKDLRDVQAIVVPGKGVAAAQARVDNTRANQKLIFDELQKGTDPAKILELLKADPAIEGRQFGILDMQGRSAGFSGAKTIPVALGRHAQLPGTDVFYAVQGNILASEAVVTEAMDAFAKASGDLADRVMAAMEAADAKGGDKRCSCDTAPKVDAPCEGKTAHVAYILAAKPDDVDGASYNDGEYWMYVSVTDRDIKPQENANPVKTLRMRYERVRKEQGFR
jgi:uncharacterized Ntn-hydrolase superfamily protein